MNSHNLKVLADVVPKNCKVEGEILFNGRPIDPATHHRDVSYITQEDNHLATLTVRETLWFSSECNLPENFARDAKEKRLDVSQFHLVI